MIVCAAFEAPAVISGFDDVAVVGQAVQQGGGHLGVAKHARPLAEGEIGRDDDRGLLIEPTRSSFMMIRSLAVTSNAGAGGMLQMPLPNPPMRHPECLVFAVADLLP